MYQNKLFSQLVSVFWQFFVYRFEQFIKFYWDYITEFVLYFNDLPDDQAPNTFVHGTVGLRSESQAS